MRSSSSSARKPVGGLDGSVVLASEILFDVILQVRIDDLRGQLRIFGLELHFNQAAIGNALDAQAPQKSAQNRGLRWSERPACCQAMELGVPPNSG